MIGRRAATTALAWVLTMTGVGLLGYVAYATLEASAYQREARAQLVVEAREGGPRLVARRQGDLIGEITSDRIGLRAVMTEGDSESVLRHAIGHVPDTVMPGDEGNAALAGHRDGLFRPLQHIEVGDIVTISVGGRQVDYAVEWTRIVMPTDVWVMGPTSGRALTLITCYPFTFVGSAPLRFIVRAREVFQPS
jgi:sortase A